MKILVVDDEPLAREELKYLVSQNQIAEEVLEAEGVVEAEKIVHDDHPEMIFLDIQLADGSGMALAERLKALPDPPFIVFATAYDQYALKAFDADAVDYVLKPFRQSRVDEAIRRVAKIKSSNQPVQAPKQDNPRLLIPNDERTIILKKDEILYLQAQEGNLYIWTTDHHKIISKQTLTNVFKELDPTKFIRIHRSFIVNLDTVTELQPSFNHTYELTLVDGTKLPVSRSYVNATKKILGV